MNENDIQKLAVQVDEAAFNVEPLVMLTASEPELTLPLAYDVQRASIERRLQRGEELIGMKMGLTSKPKMQQMGVHNPIYGHLTSSMLLDDGDAILPSEHCHPRVEPEIAFILGEDLHGPTTSAEAMMHVSGVCSALEVIDSRYKDFKFTLIDVVADNASSSHFVLGNTIVSPEGFDISNLGMVMQINGKTVQVGSSAAIYEHPARSLATLANLLAECGEFLPAGFVVLAGGATAAVALSPGDKVRLLVDGLGSCNISVSEEA
ncbi:MAG: 4-oxalocrotonate decarboxylase [Deltaproteobacteria bacterium]|nr:4-oxalocrotonate decarboxylase [Deltaproteobacteria bacterium]